MTSRFVSRGTLDAATGKTITTPMTTTLTTTSLPPSISSAAIEAAVEEVTNHRYGEEVAEGGAQAITGQRRSLSSLSLKQAEDEEGKHKGTSKKHVEVCPKDDANKDDNCDRKAEDHDVDEWKAVQRQLDDQRRRRAEEKARSDRERATSGGDGMEEMSLYAILQANKAAKQAVFEEAAKFKNQFRPIDEDEADFLEDIREKKRRVEEEIEKEAAEGLAAFRKMQKEATNAAAAAFAMQDTAWRGGTDEIKSSGRSDNVNAPGGGGTGSDKKRKREEGKAKALLGLSLLRKAKAQEDTEDDETRIKENGREYKTRAEANAKQNLIATMSLPKQQQRARIGGLVDYGSDSE